ncbi:MAG TPA: LLM class flavin-dependent oxidoreductase [Acidimicrobiales bacterium]|nr:LLM class flavin-dependent oxidoreductase [Acidimicrobiales bacterium]
MKFGLHLPNSGALSPQADLLALARRAEEIGFDAVWVFDHLFNPVELSPESRYSRGVYHNRPEMPYYDALITLAAVAGATSRIRLGTRVLIAVYRNPILVAKQVGTLAALAGPGRVILGVGAGWMYEEFASIGVPFEERFARLDEHLAVVRQAWDKGTSEFDGEFYRHPAAGFLPVPTVPVPIIIGGTGDGALRRVARLGDGWALPGPEPGPDAGTQLAAMLDRLRRICDEEGRNFDELVIVGSGPLSADEGFFDVLAEGGVAMCDLMLTDPSDLDLEGATRFMQQIGARYAAT